MESRGVEKWINKWIDKDRQVGLGGLTDRLERGELMKGDRRLR